MPRFVPTAIATDELPAHSAVQSWCSLHEVPPVGVVLLRPGSRSKPPLYRLSFSEHDGGGVFAKHFRPQDPTHERTVFEHVLSRLDVPAPRFLGAWDEPDGSSWLFLEDVGETCYAPHDPEQRRLAGRWLGHMHGLAAARVGSTVLPDAGFERYRARLLEGRAAIRQNLENPELTPDDRAVLAAVLDCGERFESLWPTLAEACDALPRTLVHADLQPKNMRIRQEDGEPVLRPIDWETAGWGVPAADLAYSGSQLLVPRVDVESYGATVRRYPPQLDDAAIQRLATIGRVFQTFAGIEWSSADLRFPRALCLVRPISAMRVYVHRMDELLRSEESWLH